MNFTSQQLESAICHLQHHEPQTIDKVLRQAMYARNHPLDLISEDNWESLQAQIVASFPYMTLRELDKAVSEGIKGHLPAFDEDEPSMNFNQIYFWVYQFRQIAA